MQADSFGSLRGAEPVQASLKLRSVFRGPVGGDWALLILDMIGAGALAAAVIIALSRRGADESNLKGREPVLLDPLRWGQDHCLSRSPPLDGLTGSLRHHLFSEFTHRLMLFTRSTSLSWRLNSALDPEGI